ncbi:MAG: pirin family protein [Pseudomonadota bacterium]
MTQSTQAPNDPVSTIIIPRARDIGDFSVRRSLPAQHLQAIGPFVFFDHMGPVVFNKGQAVDVRPHPHIGISTITWLFDGAIQHKDSLGFDVTIQPGEVNWMTSGSGIVHSERSPASARMGNAPLAGIQAWVALPKAKEEMAPAFHNYAANTIPKMDEKGVNLTLIAGSAFGKTSPVLTESETLYAELTLTANSVIVIPSIAEERGMYVYAGTLEIAGITYSEGTLVAFKPDVDVTIRAVTNAGCMLLGGDALDAPRHLYWNFVSSDLERIEQAKTDWREQRFAMVDGDPEFIPLPGL